MLSFVFEHKSFSVELSIHDLLAPALIIWFATKIGVEESTKTCSPETKMQNSTTTIQ